VPRLITTAAGSREEAFAAWDWTLLVVTALAWGSAYYFIQVGLRGLEPAAIAFVRVALGAGLLACVPGARAGVIERRDGRRIALLGLLWLALPFALFPIAQQWVSSAEAGMVTGATPVFTAVIAALLLRRTPGSAQIVGIALGFAGVSTIAVSAARGSGAHPVLGVVLLLAAVLCYALSSNVAVPLQQRYGSLPVILRALLVASVLLVVPGSIGLAQSSFRSWSLAAMVPLGLVSTGIGYVTFSTLAGRVGATRASATIYFLPLVAIVLGFSFLDETVSVAQLVGTGLVLAGAWFTSRATARRRQPPGS
jgi:drug/metabolite transporter (DMT)-like permease